MVDMEMAFILPADVADELEADGHVLVPPVVRGALSEAALLTLTILNLGATTVTLAEAPQVIPHVLRSLSAWVHRRGEGCSIDVKGPDGRRGTIVLPADPEPTDVGAALRVISAVWGIRLEEIPD